jgi:hypothetical protein
MATAAPNPCDSLEVDLSRTDLDVEIFQSPCIDVEITHPDILLEIGTVANQGPQGVPGPKGPQGDPGGSGPPGSQGLPGPAATIAVGGTVTGAPGSNATVTNTGSSSAAIFNFAIPRGDVGATGAQGNQGVQGPAATVAVGTTSTGAPGSNAAVNNSGTSSAAVFNFTIPRGDVGAQGSTGPQGPQGATGAQGATGSQGPQGATGPQGPAGAGTGDMLRSVYDINGDNIVDHAALADTATNASAVPWTGITGKPATFPPDATAELVARKGAANGYPSLDASTLVPIAQLPAPTSGNASATQLVKGNDTRLSDARTPTAHATSHKSGGGDVIALDTLAAPTDITTLNVSTSAHGLMAKATGSATTFYGSDNTQKAVPYSSLSGIPATFAPDATAELVARKGVASGYPSLDATGKIPVGQLPAITSAMITDGTIVNADLAAGVAVANIGYTPINSTGGNYTLTSPLYVTKDVGLSGTSWTSAPLVVTSTSTSGRPMIGFQDAGNSNAGALYFDGPTLRFGYVLAGSGSVGTLLDSLHGVTGAQLAAGAAVANLGFTPLNKAGDTVTSGTFNHNQGSLIRVVSDTVLNSSAFGNATLLVSSSTASYRPGIGFNSGGEGQACYLYWSGGKFHFIDAGGVDHLITSS